ncbi:hypothetical protein KIP88_03145 [Bradyrhizobium sp. SRL28]|uniref:hypothetical protein n=1 Tax=Bradyrhizobium sp. SRL28 TaxID=2836178 RepID=UPI001BDE29A1|nr:hypothetical protein [Bradyrhizobium sp. SRL28]MBT1509489.1 hypothetical protein [Bradyrhizobium sp. SRL28]
MTTPARYRALKWFHDHEALGPDEVFTRKPPTTRMHRLMAKDGHVALVPVGQFGFSKWVLTPEGRRVLEEQPSVRRRSLPRIHKAKEDASL